MVFLCSVSSRIPQQHGLWLSTFFVYECSSMIALQSRFHLASPMGTTQGNPFSLLGARGVTQVLSSECLSLGLVHESIAKSTLVWQIEHSPFKSLLLLTGFLKTLLPFYLFTVPVFHCHFSVHAFSDEPRPLFYLQPPTVPP